jgi:hypothetical protein
MKLLKFLSIALMLSTALGAQTQAENSKSEIELISETLMDYIEGTANGEPARLRRHFTPILIYIR